MIIPFLKSTDNLLYSADSHDDFQDIFKQNATFR